MLKPFQYKQDNEDAIIVLHPETGKIIADDNLEDFLPIIKRNIPKQFEKIIESMRVGDKKITFEGNEDKSIIEKIVNYLKNNISEKLIVEQQFQNGPEIRHRPLYFGVGDDENSIIIKYSQLGSFNSIDVALSQAQQLC